MIRKETTHTPSPQGEITTVRLTNSHGASVTLSSLGAGVISVRVPDREGNIEEVALGYGSPADFIDDTPCSGKTVGRYANRIAGASFRLGAETVRLTANDGANALHGGPTGFHNRLWHTETGCDEGEVTFSRLSPDGEEGYPGNLEVKVRYTWDDDSRLTIEMEARTDRTTAVNLTNHCYWNLRGASAGSKAMKEHLLTIRASRYLPCDTHLIPTGEIKDVEGTPMDFRQAKAIGRDMEMPFEVLVFDKGYDSSYLIDGWAPGKMAEEAVTLHDPATGRRLTIGSDQPAAHLYTGNWLDSSPCAPDGSARHDHDFVAIEMQGAPDAPNRRQFPDQTLREGETYRRKITYTFTAD